MKRFAPFLAVLAALALALPALASSSATGDTVVYAWVVLAAADFVCSIGCMVVILLGLPFILARAALQRTNKLDSEGGKRSLKDGQRAA